MSSLIFIIVVEQKHMKIWENEKEKEITHSLSFLHTHMFSFALRFIEVRFEVLLNHRDSSSLEDELNLLL